MSHHMHLCPQLLYKYIGAWQKRPAVSVYIRHSFTLIHSSMHAVCMSFLPLLSFNAGMALLPLYYSTHVHKYIRITWLLRNDVTMNSAFTSTVQGMNEFVVNTTHLCIHQRRSTWPGKKYACPYKGCLSHRNDFIWHATEGFCLKRHLIALHKSVILKSMFST